MPPKTDANPTTETDKDALILAALRRNARMPLVALAREIGLSRSATQERLNRLERSGRIAGYTVVPGPSGAGDVSAWFLISVAKQGDCVRVIDYLAGMPGVGVCHSVAGEIDLIVCITVPDTAALAACRATLDKLPEVARVATHLVLDPHGTPVSALPHGQSLRPNATPVNPCCPRP